MSTHEDGTLGDFLHDRRIPGVPCGCSVNTCDRCGTTKLEPDTALCSPCADDEWDRWLDRHDDISAED